MNSNRSAPNPKRIFFHRAMLTIANVEVTGAARLYRAASVWTAGLGNSFTVRELFAEVVNRLELRNYSQDEICACR